MVVGVGAALASGQVHARVPTYSTQAPCAAIINVKTGGIVWAKNGDLKKDPASSMKIATAAVVLGGGYDLDKRLIATQDLVGVYGGQQRLKVIEKIPYALERNGTHMSIAVGEEIPAWDLVHGLMMVSANDAANILAQGLEGSVEEFVRKLGIFCEAAGCTSTQFVNPHGLYHPQQYTTAVDFAKIMRKALSIQTFREIQKKKFYRVAATNKSKPRPMAPSNRLVRKSKWTYSKSLGGKTGQCFTKGGKNLISAASDRGLEIAVAVMDCPTYDMCYEESIRLSEIAFARGKESREILKAGLQPFKKRTKGASGELLTWTRHDLSVETLRGEELELDKKIIWNKVQLPIKKGDIVGRVTVFNRQGELLASEPLLARGDLSPDLLHRIAVCWSGLCELFASRTNGAGLAMLGVWVLGGLRRLLG
jgi:D-alanyl-D-alanine carboxypeptidase (penicillin-binding protein 5/6)